MTGKDFNSLKTEQFRLEGSRTVKQEVVDHQMTIAMTKKFCMLHRSERGKQCRHCKTSLPFDLYSSFDVIRLPSCT